MITYDEADTDIEDKAMYELDKAVKNSDIRKLFEKLEDYQKSDFYKFM